MTETQGTHHFILTRAADGGAMATLEGHVTPGTATRGDVYRRLIAEYERVYPRLAGGVTTFFSLELDEL